ncbi:ATP-dependent DNA ligase [Phytoactinopolyspora halotolerans]|uniref:ATP-dependent DNA ligase family profile domain-containing protein n=1 Tax=Phytoactinopolyspora halotolerans TaxID=1981512 RepID=A0A6L9S4Z1_9ACTN|nr:hypothetical protein [Phytoactinopolyspora halotolerans]NED99109.1 hypothetical protein [Phytoactinopolyspora halotolerans]
MTTEAGDLMPTTVKPMLATLAALPVDDTGRGFEIKWDGVRTLARIDGGAVRLNGRTLRDVTTSYPELTRLGAALAGHRVFLDGEVIALVRRRPARQTLDARPSSVGGGRDTGPQTPGRMR